MAQGLVSYPGITNPKGCVYTQSIGVYPDRITIYCAPQSTAIATRGTVTLTYGLSSITLPNCFFDDVQVVADSADGHRMVVTLLDRRELWTLSDTITGEYNTYRIGTQILARKKSLRELATILLQFLGEASPVVTALPTNVYPEVRWQDINPVKALDQLLTEWGFGIALGYGSEAVTVVQIGTGASLSATDGMMVSSSVDPKTRPQYTRVRFGETIMQARIKMEAVGLEDDDTWVAINSLSYKPTSWNREDPFTLPNVKQLEPASTYERAVSTVYRAFRISKFADGTLSLPDGTGTLTTIEQILPLFGRLLDTESIRSDGSAVPFRIYGKRQIPDGKGEPVKFTNSTIDTEILGEGVKFYGESGFLLFDNPQFWVDSGDYKPAEIYLECTFKIVDLADYYPIRYKKDTLLDAAGVGYRTIPYRDLEKRVVVSYGSSQSVTGATSNVTDLDAIAALVHSAVSPQYVTTGAQTVIYCEPKFGLRCDGAIHQVRHIISDGTAHAASFSSASRNVEFDRQIMTRDERTAVRNSLTEVFESRSKSLLERRKDKADD